MSPRRVLRAATRGSELARWQTDEVARLLRQAFGDEVAVEVVVVSTEGDRRTDVALERIGGRGVFVKEVQAAVLDGRADIAVHSAKDLPSSPELQPVGLRLACVPPRGNPRDALVGSTLDALRAGSVVATGSTRRRAQLAHLRPDLTFADLRGNIGTRLDRAGAFDAVVMAAAALERLGHIDRADEVLEPTTFVPQVAQGALAVECRVDDAETTALLVALEDPASRRAVDAERAFLATLGGGCDLPVGAHATVDRSGHVHVTGLLAGRDGHVVVRGSCAGLDAGRVGRELADHLLDDCGGRALLEPWA